MKLKLAFLCIALYALSLSAQNSEVAVSGFVLREDTEEPVSAKITIKAPATFEVLQTIRSDDISGSYFVKLKKGDYYFIVEALGYALYNEKVIISGNEIKRLQKNLVLMPTITENTGPAAKNYDKTPPSNEESSANFQYSDENVNKENPGLQQGYTKRTTNKVGLKIIIRNGLQFLDAKVRYAKDEDEMDFFTEQELDKLIEFMNMNQRMDIELRGYPDRNRMSAEDSALATVRADKIKTHLVLSGIQYERLTTRPFFDFEEIADIPTHQKWRSEHMVEFRIKGSPEQEQQLEEEIQNKIDEYKKTHPQEVSSENTYNLGEVHDEHNPDNVIGAYDKLMKEIEEINQKVIFFSKTNSKIEPPFDQTLDSVLQFLQAHPRVKIEIMGYASQKEQKKKLRTLPADRAFAASKYLQENGIDEERMKVQGAGIFNRKKDKSIKPEQEMRVEFEVVPIKIPESNKSIKGAPPKNLALSGNKAMENHSNHSNKNTNADPGKDEADPYEQLRKNSDLKIPDDKDPSPGEKENFQETETKSKNIKGIVYKVQIGAYSKPVDSSHEMYKIVAEKIEVENTSNGVYRYICGQFQSLNEAETFADKMKTKGISDAFVVIYNNGERISKEKLSEITRK